VVEYGCFVQLRGIGIDGLLRLEALDDDEYTMEANGQAWFAKRRKQKIGIGSAVRVIVTNANPVEGLVDLELDDPVPVEHSPTHKNERRRGRR